jgi:hypothetical protein
VSERTAARRSAEAGGGTAKGADDAMAEEQKRVTVTLTRKQAICVMTEMERPAEGHPDSEDRAYRLECRRIVDRIRKALGLPARDWSTWK